MFDDWRQLYVPGVPRSPPSMPISGHAGHLLPAAWSVDSVPCVPQRAKPALAERTRRVHVRSSSLFPRPRRQSPQRLRPGVLRMRRADTAASTISRAVPSSLLGSGPRIEDTRRRLPHDSRRTGARWEWETCSPPAQQNSCRRSFAHPKRFVRTEPLIACAVGVWPSPSGPRDLLSSRSTALAAQPCQSRRRVSLVLRTAT